MQRLIDLYNRTRQLYEQEYDIHICRKDEIEQVISFIDIYWKKGHILTKSRELMDWQYYDKEEEKYNFVIAISRKTGEIHGLIGFIRSDIYDSLIITPIRWGAIWKIREDVALKGLGVFLKGYMEIHAPAPYIGGVGLSKYSKEIDTKLGERMGRLKQFYILNPTIGEYNLVGNAKPINYIGEINRDYKSRFKRMDKNTFKLFAGNIAHKIVPYKSINYYINRYYEHPIYEYAGVAVFDDKGVPSELFIYRVCREKKANYIFIVDYIGDFTDLEGKYEDFVNLLLDENAECICFPCEGGDEKRLRNAGFRERDDSDVVLPIYFEPFTLKNVDLDYHFWPSEEVFLLVKGDSDQDRPNILKE